MSLFDGRAPDIPILPFVTGMTMNCFSSAERAEQT